MVDGELQERTGGSPHHKCGSLCIEIFSPEDLQSRTVRVLEDYRMMGVPHLWLFDPIDLLAWTYDSQGLHLVKATRISIPGTPIFVDLPALFASLDDLPIESR